MNKLIFKQEDFSDINGYADRVADQANELFEHWLNMHTYVWLCYARHAQTAHLAETTDATHRAILVCVETIEKPKCEHKERVFDIQKSLFRCADCGVEIEPTGWKEVGKK